MKRVHGRTGRMRACMRRDVGVGAGAGQHHLQRADDVVPGGRRGLHQGNRHQRSGSCRRAPAKRWRRSRRSARIPNSTSTTPGTGDPHLQAAEMGLTEEYKSPQLSQLHDWAVKQAEASKYRTVGVYSGALGIAYNPELLAKKKLPPPKCWADLANPIYHDEIQMANPNSSGTAYATLATFVQIFGEDKAFELLKGMHKNTNSYPRSGAGPGPLGRARRDSDRRDVPARRRDRDCGRVPGQARRSLRGHGLRGRLDEHRQGRKEPGEREEILRVRA